MKTDLLDKILIILMITILPIGIFVASKYKNQSENQAVAEETQIAEAKLNEAVEKIQKAAEVEKESYIEPILIDKVSYASSSGEMDVVGRAPGSNMTVMVSAVITPSVYAKDDKKASGSAKVKNEILGETVEVFAVKTDANGEFQLVKEFDAEEIDIVELRFEQSESTATVQYNLVEGRRTL